MDKLSILKEIRKVTVLVCSVMGINKVHEMIESIIVVHIKCITRTKVFYTISIAFGKVCIDIDDKNKGSC